MKLVLLRSISVDRIFICISFWTISIPLLFRFQQVGSQDVNVFVESCDTLLVWINKTHKLITETQPHPIDEDGLDEYKEKLMVCSKH